MRLIKLNKRFQIVKPEGLIYRGNVNNKSCLNVVFNNNGKVYQYNTTVEGLCGILKLWTKEELQEQYLYKKQVIERQLTGINEFDLGKVY